MNDINNISNSASIYTIFGGKKFINLNKHAITLRLPNGEDVVFPPSGQICEVAIKQTQTNEINNIPIMSNSYGDIQGIPPAEYDTFLIVNEMVISKMAYCGNNIIAPDNGPTAIIENGQVKAITRFIRLADK